MRIANQVGDHGGFLHRHRLPFRKVDLTPDDPSFVELCDDLGRLSKFWQGVGDWPQESLCRCADAGLLKRFVSDAAELPAWGKVDQLRAFIKLAAADLTTTFVLTQYLGACRRIAASENGLVADRWLSPLLRGECFATVGISHLTTSRRHLAKPALRATPTADGYQLDGEAPWVTGASRSNVLVVAATLQDGRELLAAVPADTAGVEPGPGVPLLALSASETDRVVFRRAAVPVASILAGPAEDVLQQTNNAGTGGLQTTALALGLAEAAANFLESESIRRSELADVANRLRAELLATIDALFIAARGEGNMDAGRLRTNANRLVMRITQAALTAAKGAGFVEGHPVGRWCREALFFLVWSCPQSVTRDHLCELAGIEG